MAPLKNYSDLFDPLQILHIFRRDLFVLWKRNTTFFFDDDAISSFSGGHLKASCLMPLLSKGQSSLSSDCTTDIFSVISKTVVQTLANLTPALKNCSQGNK